MSTIATTPTALPSGVSLIQNLGPGNLYVGEGTVSTTTGVELPPDHTLTVTGEGSMYAVSDSTSDVRTLEVGTGIFQSVATS